LAVKHR